MPRLTETFGRAFAFAQAAHAGKTRKRTTVPYISHLMAVSALVLEFGGNAAQAAAALLHDTVEDCGVSLKELERRFGKAIAGIVADCTDAETTKKKDQPWKERKVRYIDHLRDEARPHSLLVSAADKLHNARAIVRDVTNHGPSVWRRFNAEPREILWYYDELAKTFHARRREARQLEFLLPELDAAVKELTRGAIPGLSPEELQKQADESQKAFEKAVTERGFRIPGPDEPDAR